MRFYDLDIDVKNYAKRIVDAGYKCPADINSVSDFVKGLKIINAWQNITEIFLMRSNQNAGAGTTIYGLKKSNATMNSAVWQPNGVKITTSNVQTITLFNSFSCPSLISVALVSNQYNNDGYNLLESNIAGSVIQSLFLNAHWASQGRYFGCVPANPLSDYSCGRYSLSNGLYNDNSRKFITFQRLSENSYPSIHRDGTIHDGATQGSNTKSFREVPLTNVSITKNGEYALYVFADSIDLNNIRNVYKTTAGKGLGLP
jgi:hypothetical protein